MSAPAPPRRRSPLLGALAASFVACLLVVVGPAVLAQETGGDQLSRLSVREVDATDLDAVSVSFIWNGERGALENLTIREDGQERRHEPPVPLSSTGVETAVVVAVDVSRSMGTNGGVPAVKSTLTQMVADLEGREAMGIVTFGTEVEVLSTITTDKDDLRAAIDRIAAPETNRTALWDGMRRAAGLFDASGDLQPNIVLITDGFDDGDNTTEAEARAAVGTSGAAVFAVAYDAEQHLDAAAIARLVDHAGGAVIAAPGPEDLREALGRVERSLANQYLVTYPSAAEQGGVDLEVTVAGDSATTTFVAGAVSTGVANLAPTSPPRVLLPSFLRGDLGLVVALVAGGLAVTLAIGAIASLASKQESSLDRVIQQYTEPGEAGVDGPDDRYAQTAFVQRAVELTEEIATKQGLLVKVEDKLEMADLPLRAAEALFFYVTGALIISLLGYPAMGLIGLPIFGLAGFLVPIAVVNFLGARRQKKFNAQLPDMLQLLAGSLRAGYSLVQGVDAVATEVDGPMGRELRRVMTEARLGRELEDALEASAQRVKSKDFEWAIMAIGIQREVGGNLSELLMTVSNTMIERERLRRDVAALTAEGKMSAIILGIMPFGLGAFMYTANPDYMSQLFSTTLGNVMVGAALLSMGIGFAWMKKCITIEV